MQSLLDRPMVVDWAVPKNKFLKNGTDEIEVKPEIKTEIIEEDDVQDISIKTLNSEDELKNSDAESDWYLNYGWTLFIYMDLFIYFLFNLLHLIHIIHIIYIYSILILTLILQQRNHCRKYKS